MDAGDDPSISDKRRLAELSDSIGFLALRERRACDCLYGIPPAHEPPR